MDIFDKIKKNMGPLGQYISVADGYFAFPKLTGEISRKMHYQCKEYLVWSLNDYLGLANHPEVRKADAEACEKYGMAYPMGARMMSGQTDEHIKLENELAEFEQKESAYLLNYGYQGMVSIIDALVDRRDVIVYDAEAHACILDGVRLHMGKRFVYTHNNMENLEKQLERATKLVAETGGGILVITEGVFGMTGKLGNIKGITKLKEKFNFRLLVDDAHGFGTMGANGRGTGEEMGCQDKIDLYFATFAKSMAGIGAFVASNKDVISFLRYNMRSQIFAKSLPMPMVIGAQKRLELLRTKPEIRTHLWKIVNALQTGLKENGFDINNTESPVTPVVLKGEVWEATNMLYDIRTNYNLFFSAVIYPVIPKGIIIFRLIPTASHTLEDVDYTVKAFATVGKKLKDGVYNTGEIVNVFNQ